ncbi:hypothetical protein [Mycobacterium sp. shizuoka-1]|uniref:hypothetical protein n=1 Tax=Mycobacterium sp. shizuoka-1 TaxID=2039281 RepID=UPI000C06242B|nr:hypothetical protein [Mycobacterium sp. shizuoka-1]GAY13675.1 hypothetical protein MSZK_04010 [Mycobacterium sp. shizuoka-1]
MTDREQRNGGRSVTCALRHTVAALALVVVAFVEQIWGLPMVTPATEADRPAGVTGTARPEPVLTVVELWGTSPDGEPDFGQAAAAAAALSQPTPHPSPLMRTVRRSMRSLRTMVAPVLDLATW